MNSKQNKPKSKTQAKVPKFRYVLRKYIVAKTLKEALDNEAKAPVHEVFVVETIGDKDFTGAIGFEYQVPYEDDEE